MPDLDEMTREELLAFARCQARSAVPSQRLPSSLDVWRACHELEPLRAAIPHLATLLDYLGHDVTEYEGERGYWDVCVLCRQDVFRTQTRHRHSHVCDACAARATEVSIHLGDQAAAFVCYQPNQLLVLAKRGQDAQLVGRWLRDIGEALALTSTEEV